MLDSLTGGGNQYTSNKGSFDDYASSMKDAAARYNGYIDRGNQASTMAMDEYGKNIANPNALQDRIASGYQESPYQKYMQDMVTKRLNYNSANSGMQGSGAANRALMEELTKNTGQFQNDYINRGLGVYGQAMQGLSGASELGFRGLNSQDALLQEAAGGSLKGQMSENETNDRNNASSGGWGSLIGAGIGLAGNIMSGPAGGMIKGFAGKMFGGQSSQPTYGTGGYSMAGSQSGSAPTTGNWSF